MTTVFFTSYARADRIEVRPRSDGTGGGERIEQFVKDLRERVRKVLSAEDAASVGFFDQNNIETGEDWRDKLAEAANTTSLLVCLTSPQFFSSRWTAKEFELFRRRMDANPEVGEDRVLPLIWDLTRSMPRSIGKRQYAHDSLPKSYVEGGILKLLTLDRLRDDYETVLAALVKTIVDRGHPEDTPPLPSLQPCPLFSDLPNSFEYADDESCDICVSAIAKDGLGGRIQPTVSTLSSQVETVAATAGIGWREVDLVPGFERALAARPAEVPVVIVTSTVTRPEVSPFLAALAATPPPRLVVLAHVDVALPPPLAAARVHRFADPYAFKQMATRVFTELRLERQAGTLNTMLTTTPPDPVRAEQAMRSGIDIGRMPTLDNTAMS
jgi:hypothetical protein